MSGEWRLHKEYNKILAAMQPPLFILIYYLVIHVHKTYVYEECQHVLYFNLLLEVSLDMEDMSLINFE